MGRISLQLETLMRNYVAWALALAVVVAFSVARADANTQHPVPVLRRAWNWVRGTSCRAKMKIALIKDVDRRDPATEQTMLHMASSNGHAEIVSDLLAAGADKDAQDLNGRTPLYHAVAARHPEIVRSLIAAGADTDVKDHNGWTALHWASSEGRAQMVRTLVEADAALDLEDLNFFTPLNWAISGGHTECCRSLLAAGAKHIE